VSRRAARPARVADLLVGVMRRAGIAERIAQAAVLGEWPQLVGERIAGAASAETVRDDGILVVNVRTAAWAQELSLMTPQIIARVNAGRDAGRITGIHWRVSR
jgi:predicted nucleic acid-binding Zn ribbon protein